MEKRPDVVKNNSSKKTNMKASFSLSVTALFLNVVPILLMLLMRLYRITDNHVILYFSDIVAIIWMATSLGGFFHLTSIILAICYLCSRGQKSSKGVALSIISILFPFILWFILITFEIVDLMMLP